METNETQNPATPYGRWDRSRLFLAFGSCLLLVVLAVVYDRCG